jgi:hypothetical protein
MRISHETLKEGPTMVFLREGLGAMAFCFDFPEKLCEATGLDAILYDRQGYGQSDAMDLPRKRFWKP